MKKIFFILLLLLSCSGLQCTAMLPREDFPKAGTYKKKLDMRVMGLRRNDENGMFLTIYDAVNHPGIRSFHKALSN